MPDEFPGESEHASEVAAGSDISVTTRSRSMKQADTGEGMCRMVSARRTSVSVSNASPRSVVSTQPAGSKTEQGGEGNV